jgi:hypothetical protein
VIADSIGRNPGHPPVLRPMDSPIHGQGRTLPRRRLNLLAATPMADSIGRISGHPPVLRPMDMAQRAVDPFPVWVLRFRVEAWVFREWN